MSMVTKILIEEMGLKDITIAASSLGDAQDLIADYIEQGKVIGIQTSGIRGRIGEVVSAGKLKTPAIIRSHGGRPRAIEAGEVHIDIASLQLLVQMNGEMQKELVEKIIFGSYWFWNRRC